MRAVRESAGMFEGDESCVLLGQYFLKFVSNTSSLRKKYFRNLDKDASKKQCFQATGQVGTDK